MSAAFSGRGHLSAFFMVLAPSIAHAAIFLMTFLTRFWQSTKYADDRTQKCTLNILK